DDHLLAVLAMRHHGGEVRLRARGKEETRLHAEALGADLLQPVDGGVVAEDVVADFRARHRLAHRGGGTGDGVAAKVDRRCHRRLSFSFSSAALPGQSSRSPSWLSGSGTVLSAAWRSRGLGLMYRSPVTISPI